MMADICQVVQQGGGIFIDGGPSRIIPVLIGTNPATLLPGWSPLFAYAGLPSFFLLELQHTGGHRATWILNGAGERIAGDARSLDPRQQALLRTEAQPLLAAIADSVLGRADPAVKDMLAAYFSLNPVIRAEIGALCGRLQLDIPKAVPENAADELKLPGSDITLSRPAINLALGTDLQGQYLDACRTGRMRWPSPVDGVPVDEVHGLLLWPLVMAWRCVDRRHDLVFFVVAAGFDQETAALYIPQCGVLVLRPRTRFTQIIIEPTDFMGWLSDHIAQHSATLSAFLGTPPSCFAHYMWPQGSAHMGHYLWNELTGLERFVDGLEAPQFPLIYDLWGAGDTAFYGPLAKLFPELQGLIRQDFTTINAMLHHAYTAGIQVMRYSGTFVSAKLRKRITNAVAATGLVEQSAQVLRGRPGPVIVFGLRVENRTLTDPVQFYITLGKKLLARFGSLTVVVDGHNRRDGSASDETFASHLESRASRKPVDVERGVVAALKAALQSDRLHFVDCVGMTTFENLGWLLNAQYCVAPWGAGLAKYRWICNIPSYVLISQYCHRYKNDIRIYSDEEYMELPSEVVFSPVEIVTDRPDSGLLVEMDSPYFVNYDVEVDAVAAAVTDSLGRYYIP